MSSVDFLADLGPSAEARAVAKVLSAAAAPPWPHELRGYESARRAFEKAGTTPARHAAGFPLRRLVGVKLAAVAGALTVTGVAVAAEADVLPSPIQRAAHQVLGGVGVPEPDSAPRSGQAMASSPGGSSGQGQSSGSGSSSQSSGDHSGGVLPGTPTGTATPGQAPTASADVIALCRAYVAHPADDGTSGGLSAHDRRQLAALAGGEGNIGAYCAQVLAVAPSTPGVPQPSGTFSLPTTPPAGTPDPSRDHKTDPGSSSGSSFGPQSTDTGSIGGNSHPHTPDPTRTGH